MEVTFFNNIIWFSEVQHYNSMCVYIIACSSQKPPYNWHCSLIYPPPPSCPFDNHQSAVCIYEFGRFCFVCFFVWNHMVFVLFLLTISLIIMPYNPAILLNLSNKYENTNLKDICTPMCIAVLFTIAKIWKQPKCPLMDEYVKKIFYI